MNWKGERERERAYHYVELKSEETGAKEASLIRVGSGFEIGLRVGFWYRGSGLDFWKGFGFRDRIGSGSRSGFRTGVEFGVGFQYQGSMSGFWTQVRVQVSRPGSGSDFGTGVGFRFRDQGRGRGQVSRQESRSGFGTKVEVRFLDGCQVHVSGSRLGSSFKTEVRVGFRDKVVKDGFGFEFRDKGRIQKPPTLSTETRPQPPVPKPEPKHDLDHDPQYLNLTSTLVHKLNPDPVPKLNPDPDPNPCPKTRP
ncbi:hypothetical protein TIFTF001_024017 [Ficus carica]|uniref:Uncharacterized protein n=1 Tax=Ficus carica TaxID=3494 RepID=A0AA88DKA5_FICCA|nr:hypothetical protein TIFTF001_024017 [Ficus carica]